MGIPVDGITLAIECVGTKHSGGATVLRDLLPVLAADRRFARIVVFASPRSVRSFDFPPCGHLEERERPREERSYAARIGWYLWGLGRACRRDGADVLLCANGMGQAGRDMPCIAMVQQALPYCEEALARLPLSQRMRMGVIRRLTCSSLRNARVIVAQSPAMVETLKSRCGLEGKRFQVCRPSASPLPAGGGAAVRASMERCPGDRRILYVGSAAPHKNLDFIARAMGALRETVPGAALFVTCHPEEAPCAHEGVVPLGYLDAAGLAVAYEMATLVVQPSLIESGPLVPPEARGASRPLLVADRPWARDACGEGALYFDPNAPEDFAEKAARLLTDQALRGTLVSQGLRFDAERTGADSYRGLADLLASVSGTATPST